MPPVTIFYMAPEIKWLGGRPRLATVIIPEEVQWAYTLDFTACPNMCRVGFFPSTSSNEVALLLMLSLNVIPQDQWKI